MNGFQALVPFCEDFSHTPAFFFECFLLNFYPSFLVDNEPESDFIQISPYMSVIQDDRFGSEELYKRFLKDIVSHMFVAADLKNIEPE